jgi:hypothetical protein
MLTIPSNRKNFYFYTSLFFLTGWCWLIVSTFQIFRGTTICIFKNVTGIPCPSCGATTGIIHILHGELQAALASNPLAYPLCLAIIYATLCFIADVCLRQNRLYTTYNFLQQKLKQRPAILYSILIIITLNWVWILIK